jgi:hypothetical protein
MIKATSEGKYIGIKWNKLKDFFMKRLIRITSVLIPLLSMWYLSGYCQVTNKSTHDDLINPQFADQVVSRDALERTGEPTLSARLVGKLHGFAVNPINGRTNAALVVVDGVAQPPEFMLDDISPDDVESVAALVYPGNTSIYGGRGGHGVLVITTRQGDELESEDDRSMGVLPISSKGLFETP